MRIRLLSLVVIVMSWLLAGCGQQPPHYTSINLAGADYGRDFVLKDFAGKERTLADFRGKYVMLFFGFTQCPDVCPTALSRAGLIKKLLAQDGNQLQVIFVTIDPERDLPDLLNDYTAHFDSSFLGLYSDLQNTEAVAREFHVFYQKVPTGNAYTLDHTAITYVLDRQGKLRLGIPSKLTAEEVTKDLRKLILFDSQQGKFP